MANELPMELFAFNDRNVSFTRTDRVLIFGIAPAAAPYKQFELTPEYDEKLRKETGWYVVPKSLVFAQRSEKLADGSRLNVLRTRAVPFAERKALMEAGIKKGLKVRPVEEKAAKPERVHLTLETLMDGAIPENPLHANPKL